MIVTDSGAKVCQLSVGLRGQGQGVRGVGCGGWLDERYCPNKQRGTFSLLQPKHPYFRFQISAVWRCSPDFDFLPLCTTAELYRRLRCMLYCCIDGLFATISVSALVLQQLRFIARCIYFQGNIAVFL